MEHSHTDDDDDMDTDDEEIDDTDTDDQEPASNNTQQQQQHNYQFTTSCRDNSDGELVVPDAIEIHKQSAHHILPNQQARIIVVGHLDGEHVEHTAKSANDNGNATSNVVPDDTWLLSEQQSCGNQLKYDFVMDNEELFLLSFAPCLTRMSDKQNSMARMRILEELYKLEFDGWKIIRVGWTGKF